MNDKIMALHNGWRGWALTVVLALLIAISGWTWHALATRVDVIQTTQAHRGERITKLEAEISLVKMQLERIESKLDRVLEQKR